MKYNFWKISLIISAILPFGFIISLLTFYFHATSILGYYPKYNRPDPKTLDIYNNYSEFINITVGLWMLSFFISIPLVISYIIIKRKKINWKWIGFTIISQTIPVILFFSDILEWYVD